MQSRRCEQQLCSIAWLPVLAAPPHPGMPWSERRGAVAAPATVRPAGDGWLVSHCLGLLDGEVASPYLWQLFGWHEPARPAVVCAQLVHFASSYSTAVGPCGEALWSELLTPAYSQLSQASDVALEPRTLQIGAMPAAHAVEPCSGRSWSTRPRWSAWRRCCARGRACGWASPPAF